MRLDYKIVACSNLCTGLQHLCLDRFASVERQVPRRGYVENCQPSLLATLREAFTKPFCPITKTYRKQRLHRPQLIRPNGNPGLPTHNVHQHPNALIGRDVLHLCEKICERSFGHSDLITGF
jgi:hypothetical protein